MNEAQVPILSREWWLTVVIVGLGIHLLASYLKPQLDRIGGRFIRSWATRNAVRARKQELRIELLRESESRRWKAATEEVRYRLMSLMFMVVVVVLYLMAFFVEYSADIKHIPRPLPLRYALAEVSILVALLVCLLGAIDNYADAANIAAELREAMRTPEE